MDLEILNIASDTDNNRDIKNHTHFSKLKNSLCGDEMLIKLIIKFSKLNNFAKYKKMKPKNIEEIYKLRDYVSLKLSNLSI